MLQMTWSSASKLNSTVLCICQFIACFLSHMLVISEMLTNSFRGKKSPRSLKPIYQNMFVIADMGIRGEWRMRLVWWQERWVATSTFRLAPLFTASTERQCILTHIAYVVNNLCLFVYHWYLVWIFFLTALYLKK